MPNNDHQQQNNRRHQLPEAVQRRRDEVCRGAPVSTKIRSDRGDLRYVLSESCRRGNGNAGQNRQNRKTEKQQIAEELSRLNIGDYSLQLNDFINIYRANNMHTDHAKTRDHTVYLTCILDGLVYMKLKKSVEPNVRQRLRSFFDVWNDGALANLANNANVTAVKATILRLLQTG